MRTSLVIRIIFAEAAFIFGGENDNTTLTFQSLLVPTAPCKWSGKRNQCCPYKKPFEEERALISAQVVSRDFFCATPPPPLFFAIRSGTADGAESCPFLTFILSFPPGAQISGGASASCPALLSISVCPSRARRPPPSARTPPQQPQHLQSSRSTALSHISRHTRSQHAHARARTQTQPPAVSHTAQRLFQRHTKCVLAGRWEEQFPGVRALRAAERSRWLGDAPGSLLLHVIFPPVQESPFDCTSTEDLSGQVWI